MAADTEVTEWDLAPGDRINRSVVHARFGGSGRGGMAPSRTSPNVLIFTDPVIGNRHGYYDGWVEDVFHYTGRGQRGDQEMLSGNRALLRHEAEGRAVRLFRGVGGEVLYLGEFRVDPDRPYYRMDAQETGGRADAPGNRVPTSADRRGGSRRIRRTPAARGVQHS